MGVNESQLPYRVLTIEDAEDYSLRLQAALDGLYSDKTVEESLKEALLPPEYRHLSQLLKNDFSKDTVQAVIKDMQTALQELPLIEVSLATWPRQAFLEEMTEWLAKHGPGPGKINLNINPSIVAGVVIGYAGKILDHSVARLLYQSQQNL